MQRLIAGGLLAAFSILAHADTLTARMTAARKSCVAPCYVHFDATASTSKETTQPFHEIDYRWNFDDPGAGVWKQGARAGVSSRNEQLSGAVAGHIYETPGKYRPSVTMTDGVSTATVSETITVLDPDEVFAGAETSCFSAVGDFDGCPRGANRVTAGDLTTIVAAAKKDNAVRRLLLRRGEVFKVSAMAQLTVDGPGLIGAFGAGAPPKLQGVPGYTATVGYLTLSNHNTPAMRDWRVMDIECDGSNDANQTKAFCITAYGGIDQLTVLRLRANYMRLAIQFVDTLLDIRFKQGWPHHVWDQLAIVDLVVTNAPHSTTDKTTGAVPIYVSGERLFFAGNDIDNRGTQAANTSHNARFPYVAKAVFANNSLARAGPTQHSLKIHAPAWGSGTVAANGIGGGYSRWLVIIDNKITGGHGGWPITIGAQDHLHDERVRDYLIERNVVIGGPATRRAISSWGQYASVRNNLIDLTGSPDKTCIFVGRRSHDTLNLVPNFTWVDHNTCVAEDVGGTFVIVDVQPDAQNTFARNNLGYAPQDVLAVPTRGPVAAAGNSINAQIKKPPGFAGPLSTPRGWVVKGYPVGAGAPTKVHSDFFGKPRGKKPTIGAAQ